MKNFSGAFFAVLAFVLPCSLLIGTTDCFMGHGRTSNLLLQRRDSASSNDAKLIATYSSSPAGTPSDGSNGSFSSPRNNTSSQSNHFSYLEEKAERIVEKRLDILSFEKTAERHVERATELDVDINVQRSIDGSSSRHFVADDELDTLINSSIPSPSTSSTDKSTFVDILFQRSGGNQKKRDLTPAELRSLELAAERKVEQQVTQNVERASEIAMEKRVEEYIDRDLQNAHVTTTNEVWNPILGSKTVTKSTWFVSSSTTITESNQELMPMMESTSTWSLEQFSAVPDVVSHSIGQSNININDADSVPESDRVLDDSGAKLEYDIERDLEYSHVMAKEENEIQRHTLNNQNSVEENSATIEEDSIETIRNLRNLTFTNTVSINDLESMLEEIGEKNVQINFTEKSPEDNIEKMIETPIEFMTSRDVQTPVIEAGDVSMANGTGTRDSLVQEMFQRSMMETRFKINQLEREQRARTEVLLDHGNVESVLPLVEYSLSKNGKNELNDDKNEVDMDVEEEERKYASKLEMFQRSLMETRFKIEQLLRERLARKKGFITHQKLLEGRLYYEFIDRTKKHRVLQKKRETERETAREAIAEKVHRALLASRLRMDAHVREKAKVVMAEVKQRELLKARLAYETKSKNMLEYTENLDKKPTAIIRETSLHRKKSKFAHSSEVISDGSKSIHKSPSAHHFASEAKAMAHEISEKGKLFVSKPTGEVKETAENAMKHISKKKSNPKKGKKKEMNGADAAVLSKKQKVSLLSKLGFIDDVTKEEYVLQTGKKGSSESIGSDTNINDRQKRPKDKKLQNKGRKQKSNQLSVTEKELAIRKAAIMLARRQPKSQKEEKALQKKYGRLEPKERAYKILLDLGMMIEHPDPDSPGYDHTFDDEYVPLGEWV